MNGNHTANTPGWCPRLNPKNFGNDQSFKYSTTVTKLILILLPSLLIPIPVAFMYWFDSRITCNPYLRMQANFELLYALFLLALTSHGTFMPASADPILLFDSKTVTVALFIYGANCLLLAIPAMLGVRVASKVLFYLAWLRLALPCIGWLFSFFAIRYYLMGMRQVRENA